ncbi:hypothetical protein CEXT_386921 [Caerostris extrusa]|uniref:Maturase K n=1 Tax=Caerostris extrusa TaxID=172846 RepID=A0AAV4P605_CAEEX|nr:hypothetical protein CEXT_386921 [Caerostris extrusa]
MYLLEEVALHSQNHYLKNGQFIEKFVLIPKPFKAYAINPLRSFAQFLSGNTSTSSTIVRQKLASHLKQEALDLLTPISLLKEINSILRAFPKFFEVFPVMKRTSNNLDDSAYSCKPLLAAPT